MQLGNDVYCHNLGQGAEGQNHARSSARNLEGALHVVREQGVDVGHACGGCNGQEEREENVSVEERLCNAQGLLLLGHHGIAGQDGHCGENRQQEGASHHVEGELVALLISAYCKETRSDEGAHHQTQSG